VYFGIASDAIAQNQGAENSALGITGIANSHLFSANANPASITFLDSAQIGVNSKKTSLYGRALESGLHMALPIKNIHAALGLYNFGNSFYNFSQVNIALAKALDPNQSIGISATYFKEFVYLQSNENAIAASFGYQYQINQLVSFGAKVQQVFYTSNDRLKRSYASFGSHGGIGVQYKVTEHLTLNGEAIVHEFLPIQLGFGIKLQKEKYDLMLGLSSHESLVNAGIAIPLNAFKFNITYGFHQRLGSAIQASIIYAW
jgi:hypothetical protein